MTIFVPIILHIAIQNVFEWAYCTFCNCCFRLTHCRVNFYSFSAAKLPKISSKLCLLIYLKFFWSILFRNHFWKCLDCFFESFVFIPYASTVLSNKSWRTSKGFTPLLSFANLSRYATDIHQISFLNLAKALNLLIFRVACVNLVYDVFECKNSLTFNGEFCCFCQIAHRTICCKSLRVKSLQFLPFRFWKGSKTLFLYPWHDCWQQNWEWCWLRQVK